MIDKLQWKVEVISFERNHANESNPIVTIYRLNFLNNYYKYEIRMETTNIICQLSTMGKVKTLWIATT